MVEEIAAENLFENNSDILSQIDTTARSASEIEFDLEFQRISKLEDQLVDEIKAGIEANEFELLNEFIDIYNTGSEEKRNRLNALRSRILDILRFEEMQGNSTVTSFKTNLEE
jgi:flagellar biosynthesis chaperone FliJ